MEDVDYIRNCEYRSCHFLHYYHNLFINFVDTSERRGWRMAGVGVGGGEEEEEEEEEESLLKANAVN